MKMDNGIKKTKEDSHKKAWNVAFFLILCLMLVGAGMAAPIPISGPTVIDTPGEYILTKDITNSNAGICIDIRTSNVILNGAGKKIDGIDKSGSIGIRVYNAAMTLLNVVVKNVILSDWATGILYQDARDGQLEKVTATSNGNGIALQTAMRNTVKNSIGNDNTGLGIILYQYSDSNTLTGNTANGNGLDGIRIRFSSNNNVQTNKALNNQGDGINFNEAGNFNTVSGNTLTGNKGNGITLYKSSSNLITKNTVSNNKGNGIKLETECYNNEITGNTVLNNTKDNIYLRIDSDSNVISGNTFDKSNDTGISLWSSDRNIITGNYVRNNVAQGLWIYDSKSNVIFNNYFYNAKNSNLVTTDANVWNLSLSAQTSITGGKSSGGNSWGQPDGQGFSQITPDTKGNGICNKPLKLANNNFDNLPIKWAKK